MQSRFFVYEDLMDYVDEACQENLGSIYDDGCENHGALQLKMIAQEYQRILTRLFVENANIRENLIIINRVAIDIFDDFDCYGKESVEKYVNEKLELWEKKRRIWRV